MNRTFSPEPRMDITSSPQRDYDSPYGTSTPLQGSERMDATFSPQRDYDLPYGTSTPLQGSERMDATFSPQRDYDLPYGTSTPQQESPIYYYSESPSWSSGSFGRGEDFSGYFAASPVDDISDRTFSDRTYSDTDGSQTDSSLSYPDRIKKEEEKEIENFRNYMRAESPYVDIDEPLVDDVFEEGTFPMVLRPMDSEGYRHLSLDRGYYPADMAFDAHSKGITWQRPTPSHQSEYLPETVNRNADRRGVSKRKSKIPRLITRPKQDVKRRSKIPRLINRTRQDVSSVQPTATRKGTFQKSRISSQQPTAACAETEYSPPRTKALDRNADRTVTLSTHTPAISRFPRFGYTDPEAKILNIPPGDDLDLPSAMKKQVALVSPGKLKPLQLNVEVAPKSISQSQSGEHIESVISVKVTEARRTALLNETPPMTETVRRHDRKHGMFTPTSAIKKHHYVIRNLFDASPDYPPPKDTKNTKKSMEWEWEWLNRQHNVGPSGAGLNRTFTRASPPGTQALNRTYDAGPSGAGLNRTFTKAASPGTQTLNTTYDAEPSGTDLNRTFTRGAPPGTQTLNRTYDTGASSADLNSTYTLPSR